ncbi:MAG: hypothetical protein EZS28_051645, partial [Streblomastix strix]
RYPLQKPGINIEEIIWTKRMKQRLWKKKESSQQELQEKITQTPNPTLQVDRTNPRSPRLPSYIEQSIALEIEERLPLPNQVNNIQDAMLKNTTISPLRINFNQDSSSKLNFTYSPPELANNNQLSFFEQQVISNRNRVYQPLQPPMLTGNPIQSNNPQIQYQIRQVETSEEEDLDKQIFLLQEERYTIQFRFEQEAHDTVFGDIDCPSDLNNIGMDKQNKNEVSEEAKDALSILGDKEKHIEMDNEGIDDRNRKGGICFRSTEQTQKRQFRQRE